MGSTGLHGELYPLEIGFGPMPKSLKVQSLLRKIAGGAPAPLGRASVNSLLLNVLINLN